MSEITFVPEENDELGLQSKIPYVGIKLTSLEVRIIGYRTPRIYMTDNKTMFEIYKDKKPTGERMLYVIFK